MKLAQQELNDMVLLVTNTVLKYLEEHELLVKQSANEKTAYQKTEQLLYNYRGFKRIVAERQQEIDEIRKYGVPKSCGTMGDRVQGGTVQSGLVLPEESVEAAVHRVEASVQGTVQAIALIDKCMAMISGDPYFEIIPKIYFDGRTQEDLSLDLKCTQKTISKNKSRLVRELAMRLFPDQSIKEMLK